MRITNRPLPKHAQISESIYSDIQAGKYGLGAPLPSEADLGAAYGVSRHTVRLALKNLDALGLIGSRRGVGSYVKRDHVVSRFSYSFSSAADLLQYATSTRLEVLGTSEISVSDGQAEYLRCRPGTHWWRVVTRRFSQDSRTPVAYSEILIPLAFGSVLADIPTKSKPIFAMIEERFNESVAQILQVVCAVSLSSDEATHMEVPPLSAGLEITRRYLTGNGSVLEAVRSLHPPVSFKYSMNIGLNHEH